MGWARVGGHIGEKSENYQRNFDVSLHLNLNSNPLNTHGNAHTTANA